MYAPKDSYNLGRIYELHLAVGVQKCASPVNQVLLADGTLLSVVNQPTEYLFEHLDSFFAKEQIYCLKLAPICE